MSRGIQDLRLSADDLAYFKERVEEMRIRGWEALGWLIALEGCYAHSCRDRSTLELAPIPKGEFIFTMALPQLDDTIAMALHAIGDGDYSRRVGLGLGGN